VAGMVSWARRLKGSFRERTIHEIVIGGSIRSERSNDLVVGGGMIDRNSVRKVSGDAKGAKPWRDESPYSREVTMKRLRPKSYHCQGNIEAGGGYPSKRRLTFNNGNECGWG